MQTRDSGRIRQAFDADDARKVFDLDFTLARVLAERRLVRRDRTRKRLDRTREPLDFLRERLRTRDRAFDRGLDLGLDCVQAAAELGKLTCQVARAAGKFGELIAAFEAIVPAGGDRVIDRECSERPEPGQRRFRAGKAETRIDRRAEQGGDQYHAGCD